MTVENDAAATGASFELANAGYTEMPDPARRADADAIGSDGASLRDAADQRLTSRNDAVVRQYTDAGGKTAAPNEAVTLARAARDYASAVAAENADDEQASSETLAARIDALRSEALAQDPDAAGIYGHAPPEANPETEELLRRAVDNERSAGPNEPDAAGLDPDLVRLMQHPQVRLALEEKIGEVEQAQHAYVEGLAAAMQIARASFVSQFPELTNIPPDQLPAALEQMSRQDPARFAHVQSIIAGTEQLAARQRQEDARLTETSRRQFEQFARSEDARLEVMLRDEPKDIQHSVVREIVASAKASGVEPDELHRLFNSEPLMRNAVFQRMMYDAGKYRLMMKARDAATARALPPVQRPGTAATRAELAQSDVRSLSTRLSSSGHLKDAVALYQARKAGRP